MFGCLFIFRCFLCGQFGSWCLLQVSYYSFQTFSTTACMSASSARLSQNVLARLSLPLSSCCCCWVLALSPCLARCGLWRVRVCHILPLEQLTIPQRTLTVLLCHVSSGIQISAEGMEVAGHKSLSPAQSIGQLWRIILYLLALHCTEHCTVLPIRGYCLLHSNVT